VVHGIIKAHSGAIDVWSSVGEGTRFSLYFPAPDRSSQAMQPLASKALRILLVDDDEVLIFSAHRSLAKRGYRVTPCASPVLALLAFRSDPDGYDLLVTDVSMPSMSGPELIAKCRELRPELRAVLTSANLRHQDREAAKHLGNVRVTTKPPTVRSYTELVRRLSERPTES
jgi:two-component system, cell cycle sensor histidine kinase and response regulator CckA